MKSGIQIMGVFLDCYFPRTIPHFEPLPNYKWQDVEESRKLKPKCYLVCLIHCHESTNIRGLICKIWKMLCLVIIILELLVCVLTRSNWFIRILWKARSAKHRKKISSHTHTRGRMPISRNDVSYMLSILWANITQGNQRSPPGSLRISNNNAI